MLSRCNLYFTSLNESTVRLYVETAESIVTQVRDVLITTLIVSTPAVFAESVQGFLVDFNTPFLYHLYVGAPPPLFGKACNVTRLFLLADGSPSMLTDGMTLAVTLIASELDVAVVGETHAAFEVMTQVIASPLFTKPDVHTEDVAPDTLTPFLLH